MGTSSTALIWYLLCLGTLLFVVVVAGVLVVVGRRQEERARARKRALRERSGSTPGEGGPTEPPAGAGGPPA